MVDATSTEGSRTAPTSGSIYASIGFWVCLLVAAACYAAATLSTAYLKGQQLDSRYAAGEAELNRLVAQVSRYEQFCKELKDPSGNDTDTEGMSLEMPVDESLQFRLESVDEGTAPLVPQAQVPPLIDALARSTTLRRCVISAAALLLLIAFTMLIDQPASEPPLSQSPPSSTDPSGGRTMFRRLNRSAQQRVGDGVRSAADGPDRGDIEPQGHPVDPTLPPKTVVQSALTGLWKRYLTSGYPGSG